MQQLAILKVPHSRGSHTCSALRSSCAAEWRMAPISGTHPVQPMSACKQHQDFLSEDQPACHPISLKTA